MKFTAKPALFNTLAFVIVLVSLLGPAVGLAAEYKCANSDGTFKLDFTVNEGIPSAQILFKGIQFPALVNNDYLVSGAMEKALIESSDVQNEKGFELFAYGTGRVAGSFYLFAKVRANGKLGGGLGFFSDLPMQSEDFSCTYAK